MRHPRPPTAASALVPALSQHAQVVSQRAILDAPYLVLLLAVHRELLRERLALLRQVQDGRFKPAILSRFPQTRAPVVILRVKDYAHKVTPFTSRVLRTRLHLRRVKRVSRLGVPVTLSAPRRMPTGSRPEQFKASAG